MCKWIEKWKVPKSSNDGHWVVSKGDDGTWGCSCPVWKFRREECHHIKFVKNGGGTPNGELKPKPKYVLACVVKPTLKEKTNELFIPLIGIPDAHMMQATICYYLLKYGYSMGEVRDLRNIPSQWTAKAIYHHIETHGEAQYPETWYQH